MKNQHEVETSLQERLDELKAVPARNPQSAARGRAQFLAQAVSASESQRHTGWKSIFRKERFAMNMFMSLLVIAGLLFGGGATVNAAQDDLPSDPLYGVKIWSEDIGLQFQKDPRARVERLMDLAQVRIREMTQLIDSGQTPPDRVTLRLEQHLQQALQLCGTMDDPTLDRALVRLRDRLQDQDREMQRLQTHATGQAAPVLERTRAMLQTRLQLVDDGLLDHEVFRNAVRNGFRYGQTQTPPAGPTVAPPVWNGQQNGAATAQPAGPGNGAGPGPGADPGGPGPDVTPDPATREAGTNQNGAGGNPSGGGEPGGMGPGGEGGTGSGNTGGNGPGGKAP